MLISVHTAIGVIIAKSITTSATGIFLLAVVSHFVLDFIPHGDGNLMHWFSRRINRDLILSLNILDAFITIFYLLYIFTYTIIPKSAHIFWAVLGSILPDVLNIYYQIFKPKFLKPFSSFHGYIHNYIPSKMTVKQGLLLQLVIIICLIYITT
ncbi:MAG: hypothetical protein ABIC82_01245 [bacterium]